ncbi:MAG: hypothetical protein FJ147_08250 [Deltaproteobacteria bacterium]|nr:hypothetical protein [Deltaproteobacteria bacterium]
MYNKLFVLSLFSFFAVFFAERCLADTTAPTSAVRSLVGLKAVRVVAEDLSPTMQKTGLRKEQLEGTATEALRKNGFTVLGGHEPGRVPIVYVRLSSVFANDDGTGPISFYITLQVKQGAKLLTGGQPAIAQEKTEIEERPLLVATWDGGMMVMVGREELFFYVKQTLLNLVGDLARDHQEANATQVSRSQ